MRAVKNMVKIQEITSKKEWENFVLGRLEANFLQSWNWGKFYANLGHEVFRKGFYKRGKLVGLMLAIVERARRAMYLTVPGGPLIDWTDWEIMGVFVREIKEIAKQQRCSFVRVRPQIEENKANNKMFAEMGFRGAPMHLHAELTHQLDITRSESELLAGMRKSTRYGIRQAEKLGIRIRRSTKTIAVDEFYELQVETARRQSFVAFGRKFLVEQFREFANNGQVILYSAWLGKVKLAQAIVIFYGREADYHYGASTEEGRKYPGAYAIQWEAIKEAKRRGMGRYNFWGVAPEEDKSHRFYGVSVFKRGFGGQDVAYLHAKDLVVNWPGYIANWVIETVRKCVRRV